jgi:hypothetical protein
MDIKRYVCNACGIEVRAEPEQDHRACACNAGWLELPETDEAPLDPPADPPPE